MSDKFYQTIEIAGESEEDFLREAYLAWLESQVADEPVWPPLEWFESDFEDDEYDLPDPFEKKTNTDDTKKVFRPFYYDTGTSKSVAPDSIAPFMELLPNLELGGELRNIIDGMVEKGRLKSLSDISMMFRSKFEDAIRHRKYDPRILREADTYFGGNRSVFDSTFGKVKEKNLDKTNSYLLASAHPGIYKTLSGIFIADMNARLQSFILRAIRTEDYSMSYSDLTKMAYAAGSLAVEQGLDIVNSLDTERGIVRKVSNQFKRLLDRRPLKTPGVLALTEMSESHTVLFGRRFRLRRGESREQRLARYKKDYPVWAKQRISELEKQHLKLILAVGFARTSNSASVSDEHLQAADELIKSAKKTPGQFSRSRDLVDIACNHDHAAADLLLTYFDPKKRRTELLREVFSLGRTLSRVQDGRKVIRAKDKHAGELLAANAIFKSGLGVPSIKNVRDALAEQGYSVTDMLIGMKRKIIPGVSSGLKKGLIEEESRIRSAAGKAAVGDLSLDDLAVAKNQLKKLLKARIAKTTVKSAKGIDADNLPKVRTPGRKPGDDNGEFKP